MRMYTQGGELGYDRSGIGSGKVGCLKPSLGMWSWIGVFGLVPLQLLLCTRIQMSISFR